MLVFPLRGVVGFKCCKAETKRMHDCAHEGALPVCISSRTQDKYAASSKATMSEADPKPIDSRAASLTKNTRCISDRNLLLSHLKAHSLMHYNFSAKGIMSCPQHKSCRAFPGKKWSVLPAKQRLGCETGPHHAPTYH